MNNLKQTTLTDDNFDANDKSHAIDRDSKPIDQNENKSRYHSRNVTETNLISSAKPAFQPMN